MNGETRSHVVVLGCALTSRNRLCLHTTTSAAGSNAPLRGSKASNWEGGVRTFAFAAGGVVPAGQQGKTLQGMIHICDFYKTFVTLAGGNPVDEGGPSPQDAIDQSGYLLGNIDESPRTVMVCPSSSGGALSGIVRGVGVGLPVMCTP